MNSMQSNQIILVFDTETTGLIPKKETNIENLPYISQLSFIVYDVKSQKIRSSFNTYIKIPSGILIPQIVTDITGITNEKCENEGIQIETALGIFYHAVMLSDCIIGHNIDFDIRMINIEITRNLHSLQLFPDIKNIFNPLLQTDCTMKMTIDTCALYRTTNNFTYKKFPKLSETYFHIFQKEPENLHNSMVDTLVCLRCYLKIKFDIDISDDRFMELVSYL